MGLPARHRAECNGAAAQQQHGMHSWQKAGYQKCLWRRVGLYATGMMSAGESQRPWWQPVRMSI